MATITFDESEAAAGMTRFFSVNSDITGSGTDYFLGDVAGYAINFNGTGFSYTGSYPNQVPNAGSIATSADLWGDNGIAYGAVTGLSFDLHNLYVDLHAAMPFDTVIGVYFGASTYNGTTHNDFLETYATGDTLIGGQGNDTLYANAGISFIFLGEGVPSPPGDGPSNAVMVGGTGDDDFAIFDQSFAPYVENVAGGNQDGSGGVGEHNTLTVWTDGVTIRHISNIQELTLVGETLNLRDASLASNLVVYNQFGLDPVTINLLAYGDEELTQFNNNWNLVGNVQLNYSSTGIDSDDYIVPPTSAQKVTIHTWGGDDSLIMQDVQVAELDGGDGVDYLERNLSFTSISFDLDLTRSHNDMGFTGFIDNIERASIKSGDGDDRFVGGIYSDTFSAGGGDDLVIGGGGDDYLDGGSGYDILLGGAGKDTLIATLSSDGIDVMQGGGGDDRYYIDSKESMLAEKIGGGNDIVYSSVGWTLGGNFERLVLTGASAINGNGNAAGNELYGNGKVNVLKGGGGGDVISGGGGKDILTGGADNDSFLFKTTLSSSSVDTITDFNHTLDTLMFDRDILANAPALGHLASGAFYAAKGATHGHDSSDRFVYNKSNGAVYYDQDGSGSHASVQIAVLTGHPAIDASDFYMIA